MIMGKINSLIWLQGGTTSTWGSEKDKGSWPEWEQIQTRHWLMQLSARKKGKLTLSYHRTGTIARMIKKRMPESNKWAAMTKLDHLTFTSHTVREARTTMQTEPISQGGRSLSTIYLLLCWRDMAETGRKLRNLWMVRNQISNAELAESSCFRSWERIVGILSFTKCSEAK